MYIFQGSGVLTLDNTGNLNYTGKPFVGQSGSLGYQEYPMVLAGTQGARFGGGGTMVVKGNNAFTGDVEFNRSTTKIGHVNALPHGARTGNVTFVNSGSGYGTLDLNALSITINGLSSPALGAGTITTASGTATLTVGDNDQGGDFGGTINDGSGTVALTKVGAGTLTLSGANAYTGKTTISGGTLKVTGTGSISSASVISVGSGATFDVSGLSAPPYLVTTALDGSGATGTITGDLTVNSGAALTLTYAAGNPTITVSGNLTLNGNGTTVTVSGSPLGDGHYKLISKTGGGTVSGTVGSVTVGGSGIVGGGTPVLSISGDELYLDISGGATVVEWGSGNGTWAVGVSGWNSGGTTTFANGNAALFTDRYSTGNPIITLNTEVLPQIVFVNSTNNYTISGTGDIGGAAELRKLGPGALTLDINNANTGGCTLFSGTLNLKKASALGAASGTFTINAGTLDNTSGSPLATTSYPQAWNGDFTFAGSSDLDLGTGAVTMNAICTVTVNLNTLTVGGDISGAGFNFTKAGAGTLALNGSLGTTTGAVTVNGGTLALGGNNSFTGGVTNNSGELIVNNDGALNSASPNTFTMPDSAASKILSINGHSLTISNLTQNGIGNPTAAVVRNNSATTAATLQVRVASGSVTYVGLINDGGAAPLALTKTGGGTLTFGAGGVGGGNYTYSGDTIISGGTLTAGTGEAFPHGTGKGNMFVGAGAVLDVVNRSITVNGLYGSGKVTHSANNNAGTFSLGDGGASGSFTGVIENGAAISPFLGLTKVGSGTQTLSGVCTYTGPTLVSAGTLLVNSPGSLAAGSAVTVNANATLGGSGTIKGSVTVNSGGTLSAGSSAAILTLANGLSLGAGATNVWELAANDPLSPGTSFDQIALTGGSLALDTASVLTIKFIGTATSPSLANSFWQYVRQWQVIAGSNPGPSNFGAIDGTNGITAGTFTTTADGTGVTLLYTPSVTPPAPTPVTTMNLTPGPSTNYTLAYSGGTGAQFVLVTSLNVDAPLNTWTPVATNVAFSGSFIIPVGPNPQGFYRIISE